MDGAADGGSQPAALVEGIGVQGMRRRVLPHPIEQRGIFGELGREPDQSVIRVARLEDGTEFRMTDAREAPHFLMQRSPQS